ncbi:hypothetical protein CALVIDRAFT_529556 [Calocera viscosa TUFC12733]|uniref:Uncharacterized protein n=1 Tax=Calocera viscosa (strain TUFC12733) TaxID=1330018 RepID=A0A167J9G4_CALVF|nr:hypothetical protein CALVIDRAFT_529556 [Calocera viscosa TUFC12733]
MGGVTGGDPFVVNTSANALVPNHPRSKDFADRLSGQTNAGDGMEVDGPTQTSAAPTSATPAAAAPSAATPASNAPASATAPSATTEPVEADEDGEDLPVPPEEVPDAVLNVSSVITRGTLRAINCFVSQMYDNMAHAHHPAWQGTEACHNVFQWTATPVAKKFCDHVETSKTCTKLLVQNDIGWDEHLAPAIILLSRFKAWARHSMRPERYNAKGDLGFVWHALARIVFHPDSWGIITKAAPYGRMPESEHYRLFVPYRLVVDEMPLKRGEFIHGLWDKYHFARKELVLWPDRPLSPSEALQAAFAEAEEPNSLWLTDKEEASLNLEFSGSEDPLEDYLHPWIEARLAKDESRPYHERYANLRALARGGRLLKYNNIIVLWRHARPFLVDVTPQDPSDMQVDSDQRAQPSSDTPAPGTDEAAAAAAAGTAAAAGDEPAPRVIQDEDELLSHVDIPMMAAAGVEIADDYKHITVPAWMPHKEGDPDSDDDM